MWNKLKIYTKKISKYNTAFMLDSKLKNIINLNYNNKILLPFQLINHKKLFTYELEYNKSDMSLYLLINIANLCKYLDCNIKIPCKNKLFRILRQSIKYNKTNDSLIFRSINVNNLLKTTNIIRYNSINNLIMNNIVFDLNEEIIDKSNCKYFNMLVTDLYFYYGTIEDISLHGNKVCIISSDKRYGSRINMTNYRNFPQIVNQDYIVIDSIFFSNKLFADSELFNKLKSYSIIIPDPDFKLLNKYPLKNIKTTKTIILSKIGDDIIHKIKIYLRNYYEINNKNIELMVCYMNNLHYDFYKKIQDLSQIKIKNFNINQNISLCINDALIEDTLCAINYTQISDSSHYIFNCKHKFMIDDIKIFTNQYKRCPCCQLDITDIKYKIQSKTILEDLFSKDFSLNYNKYSHHYIMNYNFTDVKQCIKQFFKNIYFVDKLSEIRKNSCIYIVDYKNEPISLLNNIFEIRDISNITDLVSLNI